MEELQEVTVNGRVIVYQDLYGIMGKVFWAKIEVTYKGLCGQLEEVIWNNRRNKNNME